MIGVLVLTTGETGQHLIDEASSINFRRSVRYGLATLGTVFSYWATRLRLRRSPLFQPACKHSDSVGKVD